MNIHVKDIFSKLPNDLIWMKDHLIFLTLYGSKCYGLDTPESDTDLRGLTSVPKAYNLGFNKKFDQWIISDPDCTVFNIKKFFSLACANNPNVLEVLFVNEEDRLFISDKAKKILDIRDMFLSKQVKERYIGYSKAQCHRIIQHRRWLQSDIQQPPTRHELGLPSKPLIDKNQFDVIKSLILKKLESWTPDFEPFSDSQKIYLQGKVADILTEMDITTEDKWLAAARTIGLDDNLIYIIKKEKEYENKLLEFKQFSEWKKNRNPKRAALEAKFKYDTKHAVALIRLLRMGKEILETGKVNVKRTEDREELMAIRNGLWTYEQLIEYADNLEKSVKEAYSKSTLPNQPNIKFLDNLCIELSGDD